MPTRSTADLCPPRLSSRRTSGCWRRTSGSGAVASDSNIKARGLGLALPLEQFSFRLPATGPITIAFDGIDDEPASWRFHQEWPTPQHSLAVAVRRAGEDVDVRVWETLPLAG